MLEITLNGATVVASGVEAAELLRSVLTAQPAPTAPAQPAQVAPTSQPSEPARPSRERAGERTSARKPASERKPARERTSRREQNRAAQAEITRLRKAGDHDAADAIARERGWSVPAREASEPKAERKATPKAEPTTTPKATVATPKAEKRDRTRGGTRRANGHRLDCACAMCVRTMGATPKAQVDKHAAAMERPARTRDHKPATTSDKLHAPKVRTSPEPPSASETAVVRQHQRAEKQAELDRRKVLDTCSDLRDAIKGRVKVLMDAGDLDGLESLADTLDDQTCDLHTRMTQANDAGDGRGAWAAHELHKAHARAAEYARNTLHEMLDA